MKSKLEDRVKPKSVDAESKFFFIKLVAIKQTIFLKEILLSK